MQGRTTVIVGGSMGIGKAAAKGLAAELSTFGEADVPIEEREGLPKRRTGSLRIC